MKSDYLKENLEHISEIWFLIQELVKSDHLLVETSSKYIVVNNLFDKNKTDNNFDS